MSVTRVGTNKNYSDNWENIFGGGKGRSSGKKTKATSGKKSTKKKTAKGKKSSAKEAKKPGRKKSR